MARGRTLGQLVTQLRSLLGHERSPAAGAAFADHYKEALKSAQEELYDEFSWPFLYARRDKDVNAGQRYYDFPSDLPLENVAQVQALWNGQYYDIEYGIDTSHYSIHNSDDDERADPPERWMALNTGTVQYEIWPLPATTQTGGLRFHGKKALATLVDTSDTADLDDRLICYRAAVILLNDEKKAAKYKGMERERMQVLTGRLASPAGTAPVVMGQASQPRPWQGTIVRVAGT